MPAAIRHFRDFFASLRLTVVLIGLSMVLIFTATLDQVHLGVWAVQQKYFHSLFVLTRIGNVPVPVFPGGYLIGGVLLVNLLTAHICRFKPSWRNAGIWLVHTGLILLLFGELLSGLVQRDFQMRLDQGETRNFSESSRFNELAIVDATDPKYDDVVAVPERMLADGAAFQHPKLPFRVVPRLYYPNSSVQMRGADAGAPASPATMGIGPGIVATPLPMTYVEDERNLPTAVVELVGPEGSLGTWMVSTLLGMPQRFDYAGRTWKLILRPERHYQPFSLTLIKFSHDVYAGTDIPKNFSSRVRLNTADGGAGREVLIYMNNPLRYEGLTFYQASFANNDQTTILQVVRNPSWLLPYISCSIIAAGLVLQFVLHLARFAARRNSTAARTAAAAT